MDETLQDRVESKLARVAELNAKKDAMSDTTGWREVKGGLQKLIGYQYFRIERDSDGLDVWDLYIVDKAKQFLVDRPTLRECQILAHDTARLWAGESE